jgi:ABC-2 type transport system permease protein
MKIKRITELIKRDIKILISLKWRMIETFYFPLASIVIWGFFVLWSKELAFEAAFVMLAANIFWSFAYQIQSGANQQVMEDRWSETFKQIIVSPLRIHEYLIGKIILGTISSLLSFISVMAVAYFFFGFTFLTSYPMYLLFFMTIVILTSIALTIMIDGVITAFGNEYAFISWSTIQAMILFSAPFFPLEIYPLVLRVISEKIPYTWVFESLRSLSFTGAVPSSMVVKAAVLCLIYLLVSIPIHKIAYKNARKTGRLAKIW